MREKPMQEKHLVIDRIIPVLPVMTTGPLGVIMVNLEILQLEMQCPVNPQKKIAGATFKTDGQFFIF